MCSLSGRSTTLKLNEKWETSNGESYHALVRIRRMLQRPHFTLKGNMPVRPESIFGQHGCQDVKIYITEMVTVTTIAIMTSQPTWRHGQRGDTTSNKGGNAALRKSQQWKQRHQQQRWNYKYQFSSDSVVRPAEEAWAGWPVLRWRSRVAWNTCPKPEGETRHRGLQRTHAHLNWHVPDVRVPAETFPSHFLETRELFLHVLNQVQHVSCKEFWHCISQKCCDYPWVSEVHFSYKATSTSHANFD